MPAATPNFALPYPLQSDPPNVQADLQALATAVDTALNNNKGKAIGEVFAFYDTGLTPLPGGALVADGSTFNPATYPGLNTHLGGNQLPDLRGRFLRGADATFASTVLGGFANAIVVAHSHTTPGHVHGMAHTHTINHDHNNSSAAVPQHYHTDGAGTEGFVMTGAGGSPDYLIQQYTGSGGSYTFSRYQITGGLQGTPPNISVNIVAHSGSSGGASPGTTADGGASTTGPEGASGTNRNLPPFVGVVLMMQAT